MASFLQNNKYEPRTKGAHLIEAQFEPDSNDQVLRNRPGMTGKRKMEKPSFPIIHIIGLPGAGKTTLVKKLSGKYNLPEFHIGTYRAKFPATDEGEASAWVALFHDLSRQKWANCILETTGLNCRERFLREAFPFGKIVTIKLIAQRKVLFERIGKKKKSEQGGDWFFRDDYQDKYEFVRKMFELFKNIRAEIEIDTTKVTSQGVFEKAVGELAFWER